MGSKAKNLSEKKRGKKTRQVPFEETKCGSCIGLCCRYFAVEVDKPEKPEDFDDLRWYILHDKVELFVDEGDWYVQIFNKCHWLGDDNLCMNYDKRPGICREYTDEDCDRDELVGNEEPDLEFRTLEQLEAYRDEWVKRYEKKQTRKRKKAAKKAAETRRQNAAHKKAADAYKKAKAAKKAKGSKAGKAKAAANGRKKPARPAKRRKAVTASA